jgi:hypothetical protein
MAIGNIQTPARADADPTHARAISLDGLRKLKSDLTIGPFLDGIRFHEFLGIDYTVKNCILRATGKDKVDWCSHFSRNILDSEIIKPHEIRSFLDFAKQNNMVVFWSEWNWGPRTFGEQKILRTIVKDGSYQNILILSFANNWPNEISMANDEKWQEWVATYKPLVGEQIRGLGLSDQSWTCLDQSACPTNIILKWAQRAIRSGAVAVEFEPANYFFDLPRGAKAPGYPFSQGWPEKAGLPKGSLEALADALGADTSSLQAQRKSDGAPLHDASCVAFDASTTNLATNNSFRVTANFKNTGKASWPAQAIAAVRDDKKALAFKETTRPLPAREPGENASVSFEAKMSSALGADAISIRLTDVRGIPFGQSCEVLVRVSR